jgi:hypothetical protein
MDEEIDELIETVESMPEFFANEFRHVMNSFERQIQDIKISLVCLKKMKNNKTTSTLQEECFKDEM